MPASSTSSRARIVRSLSCTIFFFFNDTATTEIYTLSLHDALPISWPGVTVQSSGTSTMKLGCAALGYRSEEHTSELQSLSDLVCRLLLEKKYMCVLCVLCCVVLFCVVLCCVLVCCVCLLCGCAFAGLCLVVLCRFVLCCFFFFNDTATPEIYPLSLHDALPIWRQWRDLLCDRHQQPWHGHQPHRHSPRQDRKSTRLNSSHDQISYAVFCL